MLLRFAVSMFIVSTSLFAAELGPWDRFFTKPAVTPEEGISRAMSNAIASAYKPLNEKASPLLLQLLASKAEGEAFKARPCSVPLTEYRVPTEKTFFIRSAKPENPALDRAIGKAAPAPPCH